jgi:hypothetical protein
LAAPLGGTVAGHLLERSPQVDGGCCADPCRAGDKGNTSNIAVVAWGEAAWRVLREALKGNE